MLLLLAATLLLGVLLSWLLLRSGTAAAAGYETHSNYFASALGEQDMGAFSGEDGGYRWSQTESEVEIFVDVAASARAKDVQCRVTSSTISLSCSGAQILHGRLFRGVEAAMWPVRYPSTAFTDSGILTHHQGECGDDQNRVVSMGYSYTRKAQRCSVFRVVVSDLCSDTR